jgi:hypothetical protein
MTIDRLAAFARFLWAQRVTGFPVPDAPHFDEGGADEFERLLDRAVSYLEFGSGGSTVLAARLGKPTLSVESDRFFARQVRARAGAAGMVKVLAPDIGMTKQWGVPVFRRPTPKRLRKWSAYVFGPFAELERSGRQFPDLVLVDGRFRVACALESARQAQALGRGLTIFFDDYAERDYYHVVERHLGKPRMAGRAAIFELAPGAQAVAHERVAEFVADVR